MDSNNNYKEVYDNIYSNVDNYNFYDDLKDTFVDSFSNMLPYGASILDAGCGEGNHLKRMIKNGYDAFGIELSSVCCDKFLQDVPHKNVDIIGFRNYKKNFDALICMDVLEHIPIKFIDDTIDALSTFSNVAFLGIANHSDVINGVELHEIQESNKWWFEKLSKYYKQVVLVASLNYEIKDDIFFMFYCSNTVVFSEQMIKLVFKDIYDKYRLEKKLVVSNNEKNNLQETVIYLRKSIEELQNANVELQKISTELQNANAELQNTNAELQNVNLDLQRKVLNLQNDYSLLENTKAVRFARKLKKIINRK